MSARLTARAPEPTPLPAQSPELSVVVPMHDEEQNVDPLLDQLAAALDSTGRSWEVLAVDDGSRDGTRERLRARRAADRRIRLVALKRNFGQTAALAAGFDHARGRIVVSLDGDLQHDPSEIPRFLRKLDEGYDVVSGWRQTRPESLFARRIPSRIANWLMSKLSGVDIHDFGTTFKAYRREVLEGLDLYGDFHRFIPALARETGARITEIPIQVRARERGESHYGILRTFTVFFDLIRIRFLSLYLARPLQVFGGIGLGIGGFGGLVFLWLVIARLFFGLGLQTYRWPLFTIAIFAMLLGVQLFCLGLLGEIVVRLYFGLKVRRPYVLETVAD